jgi:hypothetical protein
MIDIPTWALTLFIVGLCAIIIGQAAFFKEGFSAGEPGIRCGVDLPSCAPGTLCMNGFCQRPQKPELRGNELPVYP